MTKLTKQEQAEALGGMIEKINWGGRGKLDAERANHIGEKWLKILNANGYEITRKGGEDE